MSLGIFSVVARFSCHASSGRPNGIWAMAPRSTVHTFSFPALLHDEVQGIMPRGFRSTEEPTRLCEGLAGF